MLAKGALLQLEMLVSRMCFVIGGNGIGIVRIFLVRSHARDALVVLAASLAGGKDAGQWMGAAKVNVFNFQVQWHP